MNLIPKINPSVFNFSNERIETKSRDLILIVIGDVYAGKLIIDFKINARVQVF